MKELYVVNCCRTAIGSFGGSLKDIPAADLGATVIREALSRAGVKPEQVDEVMFGCILTAGLGQNVARQAAIKAGADGIWVSNHGGRQLNGGPASITVLPSIASVVSRRVPIVFDSGVRRGSHVFKALASGADLVALGRPLIYGLNLGGAEGVKSVFDQINHELSIVMQLAGTKDIEAIKRTPLLHKAAPLV